MQEQKTTSGESVEICEVMGLLSKGYIKNYVSANFWRPHRSCSQTQDRMLISLFSGRATEGLEVVSPYFGEARLAIGLKLALRIEDADDSTKNHEWLIPYLHSGREGLITWLMLDDDQYQGLVRMLLSEQRCQILAGEGRLSEQEKAIQGIAELSDVIGRLKQCHCFVDYALAQRRIAKIMRDFDNEALKKGIESLILITGSNSKKTERQYLLPYKGDEASVTWIKLSNSQVLALTDRLAPGEGKRLYAKVRQQQ